MHVCALVAGARRGPEGRSHQRPEETEWAKLKGKRHEEMICKSENTLIEIKSGNGKKRKSSRCDYVYVELEQALSSCLRVLTMRPYHNADEAELGWSENCDWINIIILEMIYYWYNLSISDEYLMRLWIIVVGPNPIVIHILYMQTLYSIPFRFNVYGYGIWDGKGKWKKCEDSHKNCLKKNIFPVRLVSSIIKWKLQFD